MPEARRILLERPHRRLNQLTGEWVLVSPQRNLRPWQGQVEASEAHDRDRKQYDPECYLCPGNTRAGGRLNPKYKGTFAFDNDFPALIPGDVEREEEAESLLVARAEPGVCRVVCFSPRHDLTLAEMDVAAIRRVVDLWTEEYARLGLREEISHVQIFENKGEIMGCSNPHPHGQIWAQRSVPMNAWREGQRQEEYFRRNGRTLLSDYLRAEHKAGERIVCENDSFVALVPFWAVWPFEMLIVSRRAVSSLTGLTDSERNAMADIVKRVTVRYDNLFEVSFPYSSGIHQAPTDGQQHAGWHLHMHFYPPLMRSATVKKFLVGYEMLGEPQRDITAEAAAERLRGVEEVHYKAR